MARRAERTTISLQGDTLRRFNDFCRRTHRARTSVVEHMIDILLGGPAGSPDLADRIVGISLTRPGLTYETMQRVTLDALLAAPAPAQATPQPRSARDPAEVADEIVFGKSPGRSARKRRGA